MTTATAPTATAPTRPDDDDTSERYADVVAAFKTTTEGGAS
jgi:hypothetical protein